MTAQLFGQKERFAVAGTERLELPVIASLPDRTHRMDDEPGRETEGFCDRRFAAADRADLLALREQFVRTGRHIDGVVRPIRIDRHGVGCIDDRVG